MRTIIRLETTMKYRPGSKMNGITTPFPNTMLDQQRLLWHGRDKRSLSAELGEYLRPMAKRHMPFLPFLWMLLCFVMGFVQARWADTSCATVAHYRSDSIRRNRIFCAHPLKTV